MRVSTQQQGEAFPVPLYDGATVMSLPVDAPVIYAARARADAILAALSEAGEAVTKAGGVVSGVPDLTDHVERQGVWDAMFALSLAELRIVGWEGVFDEKGDELPFAPAAIVHLMRDARAADLYVGKVTQPFHHREREKNA